MKRMLRTAVLLLALLTAVTISGLPQESGDQTQPWVWFSRVRERTLQRKFKLQVAPSAATARLRIAAKLQAGRLEWKLRDPAGKVHLSGFASNGHIVGASDTGNLEPLASNWQLEVKLRDASGEYTAHFSGFTATRTDFVTVFNK